MSDIMLSEFFNGSEYIDMNLAGAMMSPPRVDFSNLFYQNFTIHEFYSSPSATFPSQKNTTTPSLSPFVVESYNNGGHGHDRREYESVEVSSKKLKKQKTTAVSTSTTSSDEVNAGDCQNKNGSSSHVRVERNRRKQMNEHLSVLRSLMPCFYVKRGDQASIIGGVVDYINELQQVLQSLESKKQRKHVYNGVLSPSLLANARTLSQNKPQLSPRLMNLPISPKTPLQPISPIKSPRLDNNVANGNDHFVVATSKSSTVDVEVKFSGTNLVLKTVSKTRYGQALKIISTLEDLALEVLNVSISNVDNTMIMAFTIKIGIECQLSADELAYQIQQTFC